MMQVAIVTGGASGIGRAVASALVERGVEVTLADIEGEEAQLAAAALGEDSAGRAIGASLDVRDSEAVTALVTKTEERHGRLDFMFNNAGVGVGGPVEELDVEHWYRAIDVNLRGVVNGVQAAYPIMVRQGFGHIVNTASLGGLIASPGLTPYATTKWAVVGLSLSLHCEAADHGVNVSVVCPGWVDTPMLDRGMPDDLPDVPTADTHDAIAAMGMDVISSERLADEVLQGLDRNKALIVTPRYARIAWRLARWAPSVSLRVSKSNHKKIRDLRPST